MIRFIIQVLTLAAALVGLASLGSSQGWFDYPSYTLEIVIFLAAAHLGGYCVVIRQLNQRPEDFVKIYLGLTVLRILFFGIFIFAVIKLDAQQDAGNALFFLVSYFLFTALEVIALFQVVNGKTPTKTGQKGL